MNEKRGIYFGACVSIVIASLAFALPAYTSLRVLWYYPLEHRWAFEAKASAIAMDWYGRALLSCVLGAFGFGIAWAIARRKSETTERAAILWAAWAATAVVLCMSVYTYQLANRRPIPEPLPSWYQPQ